MNEDDKRRQRRNFHPTITGASSSRGKRSETNNSQQEPIGISIAAVKLVHNEYRLQCFDHRIVTKISRKASIKRAGLVIGQAGCSGIRRLALETIKCAIYKFSPI